MTFVPLALLSLAPLQASGEAGLEVWAGFSADLVVEAPAIRWPSAVFCLDDGSLLVGEDPMDMPGPADQPIDRIVRISFQADGGHSIDVFAEDLYAVFGIEQVDDAIYVMNMPHLTRLRDVDGDGVADERTVVVSDLGPEPPGAAGGFNDHAVTGIRLGMDGFLYVSVGDKGIPLAHGTDGSTISLRGGGVVRLRPDGSDLEVVASGTRNHLDVVIDERGEMFTYDNTDDGLGWWTRLTHIVPGGYYGYPWDYLERPERMLPCITDYGSGSPCGGLAYREAGWPRSMRGDLFWCEWGKSAIRRFDLDEEGGTFVVAEESDFVTAGGVDNFRPVDLCESPDGRFLYVADWAHPGWQDEDVTGRIWRIRLALDNPAIPSRARVLGDDVGVLVDALGDESFRTRLRAQRRLAALGESEGLVELLTSKLLRNPNELKRRHALWTFVAIGGEVAGEAVTTALDLPWDDIRVQAMRAYAHHGRELDERFRQLFLEGTPRVRREAAAMLGRFGGQEEAELLASSMQGEDDLFVRWEMRRALARIGTFGPEVFNWVYLGADHGDDLILALDGLYRLDAVEPLAAFVTGAEGALPQGWQERLGERRALALAVLSELHRKREPWDGTWWSIDPAKRPPPPRVVEWEGTAAVVAAVRASLDDPAIAVRRAALDAVRTMPDPEALPLVRSRFGKESDADTRALGLDVLAALRDGAAAPLLASILRDPGVSDELRGRAVRVATEIATPGMEALLLDAARSGTLAVSTLDACLRALGAMEVRESEAVLTDLLASESATVRKAAASALAGVVGLESVDRLLPLLGDSSLHVRLEVIEALGGIGASSAVPALIAQVDDPRTRGVAVEALARHPDSRALDVYLAGLDEQASRPACREALRQLRDRVRPELEQRFEAGQLAAAHLDVVREVLLESSPILEWSIAGPAELGTSEPTFADGQYQFEAEPLEHRADRRFGRVDLAELISTDSNLEVYAVGSVYEPVARDTELVVGSDDMIAIWIGGELVHDNDVHRAWGADQDRVRVRLEAGTNEVVARIGQGAGDWAFSIGVRGAAVGPLFADPEAEIAAAGVEVFRAFALENEGDIARGFHLFRNERLLACVRCHSIATPRGRLGERVGPDLDGIGDKYDRADLIESVLVPSATVATGYRATTVRTTSGQRLFGLIASENERRVLMIDSAGDPRAIALGDIVERTDSELSLMPDGLHTLISEQGFADLIAFLQSLGGGGAEEPSTEDPGEQRERR